METKLKLDLRTVASRTTNCHRRIASAGRTVASGPLVACAQSCSTLPHAEPFRRLMPLRSRFHAPHRHRPAPTRPSTSRVPSTSPAPSAPRTPSAPAAPSLFPPLCAQDVLYVLRKLALRHFLSETEAVIYVIRKEGESPGWQARARRCDTPAGAAQAMADAPRTRRLVRAVWGTRVGMIPVQAGKGGATALACGLAADSVGALMAGLALGPGRRSEFFDPKARVMPRPF